MAEYISREDATNAIKSLESSMPAKDNYAKGYDAALGRVLIAVREVPPTADVQPVNQWISVKDRLPEIGKSVLIYYPYWGGDEIQVAKLEDDEMMFDVCGEFNIRVGAVTHWMPLPEPPKDGDTE